MNNHFRFFFCFVVFNISAMEDPNGNPSITFGSDRNGYKKTAEFMGRHGDNLLKNIYSQYSYMEWALVEEALIQFLKEVRPMVTVVGKEQAVPNDQKYKGKILELQLIQNDEHQGMLGRMKSNERFNKLYKAARCVAFDNIHKKIYLAGIDNYLYSFDTSQVHKESRQYTTAPISALLLCSNNEVMIAKAEDGEVIIWHTQDTKPRVRLESRLYSKDYVFDSKIVRSHADKSAVLSYFDSDVVYNIPRAWIDPNYFSNDKAKLALLYRLYEIYHDLKDADSLKNSNLLATLYKAPILNTFEPVVTNAFKNYIASKALALGIDLPEDDFVVS